MPTDEYQHLRERGLTQESLYRGQILKLRLDTVAMPDGAIANREIVEHPGAVAILPITDDDQIVMVRQFRYAIGRITLEVPAGTCEPQEDAQETARRELREETGCEAASWRYLGEFFVAPGYSTELIRLYEARGLTPCERPPADDVVESVLVPLPEALAMIEDGRITDAKTIIGLLRLAATR